MIRLECPSCSAQLLAHERKAMLGIECRCGTMLGADAVAATRVSLRDLELEAPALIPVALPRAANRTPVLVGAAVAILIAGWLGAVAYRNRGGTEALGAVVDPNDEAGLRAALPRVVAGFELTERGTDGPLFDVLTYGTGAIVSPDGFVLTNRHVVRDIARLQNIANDEYTFDWFTRNVVLKRLALAIRAERERARRIPGLERDVAALSDELEAVEAEDPDLVERSTSRMREALVTLKPKLWLLDPRRLEPVEAKPVFVPDGDELDVAVLGCGVRFDRFLRLRRTRDGSGTPVRGYTHPTEARIFTDVPRGGFDPLELLVARHGHPRDEFADRDDRYLVTRGALLGFRTLGAHDGTRLVTIEHGARMESWSRGGPFLDDEAAVIGIQSLPGDRLVTLSVPDLFDTLSPYLPAISWTE